MICLKGIASWATLAQLVERLIRNQQVASSILAGGSRLEIQLSAKLGNDFDCAVEVS